MRGFRLAARGLLALLLPLLTPPRGAPSPAGVVAGAPSPAPALVFRGGLLGVGVEVRAAESLLRADVTVRCMGVTQIRGGARFGLDGRVVLDERVARYLARRGVELRDIHATRERVDVLAHVGPLGAHRVTLTRREAPPPPPSPPPASPPPRPPRWRRRGRRGARGAAA